VLKGSAGALAIAGLPAQHPLQAPHQQPLRGPDSRHAEEQQAGEAARAESVSVGSSLPAEQEP